MPVAATADSTTTSTAPSAIRSLILAPFDHCSRGGSAWMRRPRRSMSALPLPSTVREPTPIHPRACESRLSGLPKEKTVHRTGDDGELLRIEKCLPMASNLRAALQLRRSVEHGYAKVGTAGVTCKVGVAPDSRVPRGENRLSAAATRGWESGVSIVAGGRRVAR